MKPEEQTPPNPPSPPLPPTPPVPGGLGIDPVREQDKLMLVFSYLSILALIPLLTSDQASVKWHAKNGLVLGLGGAIVLAVLGSVLSVLGRLGGMLITLGDLTLLIIDIVAMLKALKGERFRIPVVTDLAEKF